MKIIAATIVVVTSQTVGCDGWYIGDVEISYISDVRVEHCELMAEGISNIRQTAFCLDEELQPQYDLNTSP